MITAGVPTLQLSGASGDALSLAVLRTLERDALVRFLMGRRWFGGKGRSVRDAVVDRVIRLDTGPEWNGPPTAVVPVRMELDDGTRTRYQLLLSVRDAPAAAASLPAGVLAHVTSARGEHALLVDAPEEDTARRALGSLLARGGLCAADGAAWRVETVSPDAAALAGAGARLSTAEQSNTSLVFGDAAIFKLFRRLEEGENPDVEIGRFLTIRTTFRNTPALLAVVHLDEPDGASSVAGMLQRFLPGSEDAWGVALGAVQAAFATGADARIPFADDAHRLGAVTRAMHDALASDASDPAFAPQPAVRADVEAWCERALAMADGALALLTRRREALTTDARAAADALLDERAAVRARVDAARDALRHDAGARIRHHGDYHLGQVLRTRSGEYMVIDFEGEPARPLAERRRKESALRDVAGMLRSFSYAAAAGALATDIGRSAAVVERSWRWEEVVRRAFLDAYLQEGAADRGPRDAPTFLPRASESTTALLTLFEMEKVFYEVTYELNNRPDWVWIPLRGARALLAGERSAGAGATHEPTAAAGRPPNAERG